MAKPRPYQELMRRYANDVPENPQEMVHAHAGLAGKLGDRKWFSEACFNEVQGLHDAVLVTPARLPPGWRCAIEQGEDVTCNLERGFFRPDHICKNGFGFDRGDPYKHRGDRGYAVGSEINPPRRRNFLGDVLEEFWGVVEGNAPIAQRVFIAALERIARITQHQCAGCQYRRPVG